MYYSKCDFLHLHLGPILQGNHIFVTLYGKVKKKIHTVKQYES